MEIFLEVMKPLVLITEAMGGEKWVSISSVRPLLHKLSKYLEEVPSDLPLKKSLKRAMLSNLKGRYIESSVAQLLNKACFLDPRFKSLSFLSDEDKKAVVMDVENEAKELRHLDQGKLSNVENDTDSAEPRPKRIKKSFVS